jgi:hypothetical protein
MARRLEMLVVLGMVAVYGLVPIAAADALEWDPLSGTEIVALATAMHEAGEAQQTNRVALVTYIEGRFLASAQSVASLTPAQWSGLKDALSAEISTETRARWGAALLDAFTSQEYLAAIPEGHNPEKMLWTAMRFGQERQYSQRIVAGSEHWQGFTPLALSVMCEWLSGSEPGRADARASLVQHVQSAVMTDPEKVRSLRPSDLDRFVVAADATGADLSVWSQRIRAALPTAPAELTAGAAFWYVRAMARLSPQLDEEYRAAWAERVSTLYLGNAQALAALSASNRERLYWGIDGLSADHRSAMAQALMACEDWTSYSDSLLSVLPRDLPKLASGQALRRALAERITQSYLPSAERVRAVPLEYWLRFTLGLSDVLTVEERATWASRLKAVWQPALAEADAPELLAVLNRLGDVDDLDTLVVSIANSPAKLAEAGVEELREIGRGILAAQGGEEGPAVGYAAFAQRLAQLARDGGLAEIPWWTASMMSVPLGTVETRQVLQNELTDEAGIVRPGVARIVAFAQCRARTLSQWVDQLNQSIAGSSGDIKAGWLIAKACAQSARDGMPAPLEGMRDLQMALSVAESEALRLAILKEITSRYAVCNAHKHGISLLQSVTGQFSQAGAAQVAEMEASLIRDEAETRARRVQQKAQRRQHLTETKREVLLRRLEVARTKGDQENLRQLERALGISQ